MVFPKLKTLNPKIIKGTKKARKIKHPIEAGIVPKMSEIKIPPPLT